MVGPSHLQISPSSWSLCIHSIIKLIYFIWITGLRWTISQICRQQCYTYNLSESLTILKLHLLSFLWIRKTLEKTWGVPHI